MVEVNQDLQARSKELRRRLTAVGFDDVRFTSVTALTETRLRNWLAEGMQADMAWIERTADKRLDPKLVLPEARSVIMLGINYWSSAFTRESKSSSTPTWARYALHQDYHDTVKEGLVAAGKVIEELFGVADSDYRYYVDTGPVLERAWAVRAGLGFQGKNGMLISRRFGNWLFLAAILAKIELVQDEPVSQRAATGEVGALCGKCTRCMDACPTDALPRPGVVDARRCISYQTIENKGVIPREFRDAIGDRIYGCDVCLEVCPWNRFAQEGRRVLLSLRGEIAQLKLDELLRLRPESFARIFKGTAIKRIKLAGILRNACIVAGNSEDKSLLPSLAMLSAHALAVVRVHAVWAVFKLVGTLEAKQLLAEVRAGETDSAVLEEYEWWECYSVSGPAQN